MESTKDEEWLVEGFVHCRAKLSSGITMHFVEKGHGTPVILCHGWPDCWYTWRHQMVALAANGYRAIAPDQRGFGGTSAPREVSAYTQEELVADLVALLDVLHLQQAVFIGHDWGGAIVWNMALHHPNRVQAVGAVSTPFFPVNPTKNPLHAMEKNPGRFDYQLYFQEPGRAEREFEEDVAYTLTCLIRGSSEQDLAPLKGLKLSTSTVRQRGGMLKGFPPKSEVTRSVLLTEYDLRYYVHQFKQSGFHGGLNWYRNVEANWQWNNKTAGRKITPPALMITSGQDSVFSPSMTQHMEQWVAQLERAHVERAAHWPHQECPQEVNATLLRWLSLVAVEPDVHHRRNQQQCARL
ncbi:Bifunctional epoxide hydrolase 2 [Balamuthia mandrillaris]